MNFCILQPSCSIHVNLLYGAVYRVSPSDRMMTSTAAPGLVVTLGRYALGINIHRFEFGVGTQQVKRGCQNVLVTGNIASDLHGFI